MPGAVHGAMPGIPIGMICDVMWRAMARAVLCVVLWAGVCCVSYRALVGKFDMMYPPEAATEFPARWAGVLLWQKPDPRWQWLLQVMLLREYEYVVFSMSFCVVDLVHARAAASSPTGWCGWPFEFREHHWMVWMVDGVPLCH